MLRETTMRLAHALAILVVAASLSAAAAVPEKMHYQGYLTSGGVPVNATVSMTVKLYDAPTDGTLVWSESQSVPVANGVYNVTLGNTTPLTKTILNGPRYLTVAVGGDPDMTPRTPLASAPYAILAKELDGTLGSPGLGQVLTGTAGGVPQWSNNTGSTPLTIAHPAGIVIQGVTLQGGDVDVPASNIYRIGGNQVVGPRQPSVLFPNYAVGTDASGVQVATVDEFNHLVARVRTLLSFLENHGLTGAGILGPPGSSCANGWNCQSGECAAGFCTTLPNGAECEYNSYCTSLVCSVGFCRGPNGSACTYGSQCVSHNCQGGLCVP